jgi:hypothetical protein
MADTTGTAGAPASVVKTAQLLQTRRENWKKTLDAVPAVADAKGVTFPYASMDAAIKDKFARLDGGADAAFRFMVKGYKTIVWRVAAEKNRTFRDALAEGDAKPKARKVRVKVPPAPPEPKADDATDAK